MKRLAFRRLAALLYLRPSIELIPAYRFVKLISKFSRFSNSNVIPHTVCVLIGFLNQPGKYQSVINLQASFNWLRIIAEKLAIMECKDLYFINAKTFVLFHLTFRLV